MAKRIGSDTTMTLSQPAPRAASAPVPTETSAWDAAPATRALFVRLVSFLERNEDGSSFAALRDALAVETDTLHFVLGEATRRRVIRRVGARTATLYLLNPRDEAQVTDGEK